MNRTQFRVLYREFLFRMVDLDLLSAHAQGDSNRLLGRFASLLVFVSILLTIPALGLGGPKMEMLFLPLAFEHFLISTTMLVVGLFAVFTWESTFPDRRDVLVLAPLPVRARTFFLAKVAAVAAALGMTVLALNALPGLLWPLALAMSSSAVDAPTLTTDPALPPAGMANLKTILDRDLAPAIHSGAMAPGTHAGLVVGVSRGGARQVLAYGIARPDSIFEIGSVSKTFTGLLLARLIAEGKVRLDEPVRDLLPPEAVRRTASDPITLLDLATHRSGMGAMPDNVNPEGEPNPGADYHVSDLYTYLRRRGLGKRPDVPFTYSNLGVALLGQALAEHAGLTYADLLQQQIAGPLSLRDTTLTLSAEQQNRLIQAYGHRQNRVPAWDLDALAPAGAIRSTAADLLTLLDANLHPERLPADFAAAVRLSHVPRGGIDTNQQIALAWVQDTRDGAYWHNGAISGYTSYVFFRPQDDSAGVVLFNQAPDVVPFADLVGRHLRERLAGEPAVSLASVTVPAINGRANSFLWFTAYWITMVAAGVFIFCCILGLQGLAAQLLPRRWFLRASSFLQLAVFAILVAAYFTQPMMATPDALIAAQGSGLLAWSPSYWFLGVMQQAHGSPMLAVLARRAWVGLAIALAVTAVAYALAYYRTLRQIVEEPDIVPGARGIGWLPPFGTPPQTAIAQFTIRTLARSRQHRVILAFYLSIGCAMTVFLLRSPEITERILDSATAGPVSIPILASTLILTIFAILGTRVLFSIPRELRANWLFRSLPTPGSLAALAAVRRALLALSLAPVWLVTAALCLGLFPWRPALAHLAALGLFGIFLADVAICGFRKIPFTCSYLPGKSPVHIVILGALGLLYFTLFAVKYERDLLAGGRTIAGLIVSLVVLAFAAHWRSNWEADTESLGLEFEDAPSDEVLGLGLAGRGAA